MIKSESAPSVRLEPCPQGHGGTVGKCCAYFVDERYLASLGLMALEIRSRIPMQPSPAKPWKLALVFPMQLRGSTIRSLPRGSLKNHRLEKNNFGPPVKSNRYFFKLPRRMPHRTIFAESGANDGTYDFSRSVTDGQGNRKIENRALMKVHLRCEN